MLQKYCIINIILENPVVKRSSNVLPLRSRIQVSEMARWNIVVFPFKLVFFNKINQIAYNLSGKKERRGERGRNKGKDGERKEEEK